MQEKCDCGDKPSCLGVVIIVLVLLWLTGNCNHKPPAEEQPEPPRIPRAE